MFCGWAFIYIINFLGHTLAALVGDGGHAARDKKGKDEHEHADACRRVPEHRTLDAAKVEDGDAVAAAVEEKGRQVCNPGYIPRTCLRHTDVLIVGRHTSSNKCCRIE